MDIKLQYIKYVPLCQYKHSIAESRFRPLEVLLQMGAFNKAGRDTKEKKMTDVRCTGSNSSLTLRNLRFPDMIVVLSNVTRM